MENMLVVAAGLCVRAMMSIHPHSGQASPPLYGDYEAQRHWQEITVNLPMDSWYFDVPGNDLKYWGLDYPPLTAYHSYLAGRVAEVLDPSFVALNASRGLESPDHKTFMRATVLLSDVVFWVPATLAFGRVIGRLLDSKDADLKSVALLMSYPGLILMDNGHFQYNQTSLGLAVLAVVMVLASRDCLASLIFVLALNYKQMELYHALPFFCYLLGKCVWEEGLSAPARGTKLLSLAVTVVATFTLLWLPFGFQYEEGSWSLETMKKQAMQILKRIFPVSRGLFEDKVANFWCPADVLLKLRNSPDQTTVLKLCAFSTGLLSLPSNILVFLRPTGVSFLLALLNTATVFFLFSYQVHEKSILLVAMPLMLVTTLSFGSSGVMLGWRPRHLAIMSVWFLVMTVFSMYPLLVKDHLAFPSWILNACFLLLCHKLELFGPLTTMTGKTVTERVVKPLTMVELEQQQWMVQDWAVWTLMNFSLVGCIAISYMFHAVDPPDHLPFLWPFMVSAYCAAHFLMFATYFHYQHFKYFSAAGAMAEGKGGSSQTEYQRDHVSKSRKKNQ